MPLEDGCCKRSFLFHGGGGGSSLDARNKYVFESGFDAVTACNATADALSPAVQDLISSVIASPDFGRLILPATSEDSSVRAY